MNRVQQSIEMNFKMSNILPPPIFSLQMASIWGGTSPPFGGDGNGGGNVSMDQVLTLLTAAILQMRGTLAVAMKNNV